MKFVANIIIFILLLFSLCIKNDDKSIENFPKIGFNIILYEVLGVFSQFFYYFINYFITEFNFKDLNIYPNKRKFPFKFFQSLDFFVTQVIMDFLIKLPKKN